MTKPDWLPMPEDFIPLDGTSAEPPVETGRSVDVWFRMGRSSVKPKPAGVWHWGHSGGTGDIIGYRLADTA